MRVPKATEGKDPKMQNNGQLEHTSDASHWIMGTAQALGSIRDLVKQQENIAESCKEAMIYEQKYLAKLITRANEGRWSNPETVVAEDIRQANEAMEQYQKDIERHQLLAAAYRAAAAIIEAATGEFHYAARDGWYNTEIVKFETAEARDEYIKSNPNAGWREATEKDLEKIYWASVLPTTPKA